ncbi:MULTISPECIES: hypothetical protein [Saccharothrix]|uniref:hypothetical protein n=1 Tax=Saccharothrix TaxID=2071 RepID=UPI00093B60FC|nr:hypothetical protein [Saccharothrix sp. CB00851]OKI35294.1 hypothetical protein A6A25_24455 [Saccharothrix sp. CB00851]
MPTTTACLASGETMTFAFDLPPGLMDAYGTVTALDYRDGGPQVTVLLHSGLTITLRPEGIELTERRWRLLGRARSLRLDGVVGGGPDSHGSAVDVRRALYEAGLLCRNCGAPVAGEVAETLGRCDDCRPTDSDGIAALITSGCPGAHDVRNDDTHDADEHGTCVDCHLPLGRLRTRAEAAAGPDTARAGRHRLN